MVSRSSLGSPHIQNANELKQGSDNAAVAVVGNVDHCVPRTHIKPEAPNLIGGCPPKTPTDKK